MHYKLPFISCFLFLFLTSSSAQIKEMTSVKWQEDLTAISNKILKAYPGFTVQTKQTFLAKVNALHRELPNLTNEQSILAVGKIAASINDGHTEISLLQGGTGFQRLPFYFYFFGTDLHIIIAPERLKQHIGKKVKIFGNVPTQEVYQKIQPLLAHDNAMEWLHEAPRYMAIPEILAGLNIIENRQIVDLLVEDKNGVTEKIQIPTIEFKQYQPQHWLSARQLAGSPRPFYIQKPEIRNRFQYLPAKRTMYFKYSKLNDQKGQSSIKKVVRAMFKEIDQQKAKRLIVDVRNNGGGNYHKSAPLLRALEKRRHLEIIVLNNRVTFSAASVTTIRLKRRFNAKIYGEPGRSKPNGTDNAEYFYLPNSKLKMWYTNKFKDHWPEMGDADRIPVDVPVNRSFEAYELGKDLVLEMVLKMPLKNHAP